MNYTKNCKNTKQQVLSYLIEEHHDVVVGLVEVGEEGHVDLLDVAGDHEDVLVHQPPTDLLLVLERSLVEQKQPISVWKVVVQLIGLYNRNRFHNPAEAV